MTLGSVSTVALTPAAVVESVWVTPPVAVDKI
jgi:hypothetical protein